MFVRLKKDPIEYNLPCRLFPTALDPEQPYRIQMCYREHVVHYEVTEREATEIFKNQRISRLVSKLVNMFGDTDFSFL
jgi:hypothetical protein